MGYIGLSAYIENLIETPFEWGTHDCLTFVNGAHRAMTGGGFCDDWCGGYRTMRGALRKYRRQQGVEYTDIIEAVDARLERKDIVYPPRGAIAARPQGDMVFGYSFGVSVGRDIAFPGRDGLAFLPPAGGDIYWVVR